MIYSLNKSDKALRRIQFWLSIVSGLFAIINSLIIIISFMLKDKFTLNMLIENPSISIILVLGIVSFLTGIDLKNKNKYLRMIQVLSYYVVITICLIVNPLGSLVEILFFIFVLLLGIVYGYYKKYFWEKFAANILFFSIIIIFKAIYVDDLILAINSLSALVYFLVFFWLLFKEVIEEFMHDDNKIYSDIGREFIDYAHNLKSPIFGILGFFEMIKSLSSDPEIHSLVESQEKALNLINDQLKGYLSLAELSLREKEIPVSLKEVVDNVLSLFNINNEFKRKVRFTVSVIKDGYILIKPSKLIQVVQNLIKNSYENCKESCILKIEISRVGDIVTLSLKDNGNGIKCCFKCKSYNSNCMMCNNLKNSSGLGLLFVRNVVSEIGGKFKIVSDEISGTMVIIDFPIVK